MPAALHTSERRATVALLRRLSTRCIRGRGSLRALTAAAVIEMRLQTTQSRCLCSGSSIDKIGQGEGNGAQGSRAGRESGRAECCARAYRARVRCGGLRSLAISGGKARSVAIRGSGKPRPNGMRKDLPSEHGFRFVPRLRRSFGQAAAPFPCAFVCCRPSLTPMREVVRLDFLSPCCDSSAVGA